jgi:hypothetical protein
MEPEVSVLPAIQPGVTQYLSRRQAEKLGVMPLAVENGVLKVACPDPQDCNVLDGVFFAVQMHGLRVELVQAEKKAIREARDAAYGKAEVSIDLETESLPGH